ncbi:hypothetical protein A3Q56_05300 [Intoshia linei]|uniref:Uncharacterized protein n=1 Tax=Intoshia linei TaxID=1819745 RepID=A0A177B036_9BILA|nr:hypothetical protein A3Q56_05300 [Intoshia linei]
MGNKLTNWNCESLSSVLDIESRNDTHEMIEEAKINANNNLVNVYSYEKWCDKISKKYSTLSKYNYNKYYKYFKMSLKSIDFRMLDVCDSSKLCNYISLYEGCGDDHFQGRYIIPYKMNSTIYLYEKLSKDKKLFLNHTKYIIPQKIKYTLKIRELNCKGFNALPNVDFKSKFKPNSDDCVYTRMLEKYNNARPYKKYKNKSFRNRNKTSINTSDVYSDATCGSISVKSNCSVPIMNENSLYKLKTIGIRLNIVVIMENYRVTTPVFHIVNTITKTCIARLNSAYTSTSLNYTCIISQNLQDYIIRPTNVKSKSMLYYSHPSPQLGTIDDNPIIKYIHQHGPITFDNSISNESVILILDPKTKILRRTKIENILNQKDCFSGTINSVNKYFHNISESEINDSVDLNDICSIINEKTYISNIRSSPTGRFIAIRILYPILCPQPNVNYIAILDSLRLQMLYLIDCSGSSWPISDDVNLKMFPIFVENDNYLITMYHKFSSRKVKIFKLPVK